MAHDDANHWAVIRPNWGILTSYDVKESTRILISQPTQVAGAAIVVDSMVVLKMMMPEGVGGLLRNKNQAAALYTAYQ
jgi:hypothetical protein